MAKPDRKPDPDYDPDYDAPDPDYDDAAQDSQDLGADAEYEPGADPDYEVEAQEEYTELVDPDYEEVLAEVPQEEVEAPEPIVAAVAEAGFAYEVGWAVLPLTQSQPHPVVWRGHLKERHPATGLLHRVPVYRLADGYWDCYREEELQVA
ncbi:MAG: hypothetical protein ACRYFX_10925 [Janthinobacterium lividum]